MNISAKQKYSKSIEI